MSALRQLGAAIPTAVCALAADVSALYLLTGIAGWHYLAAASVGFVVGTLVAWLLSVRFVFAERRFRSPTAEFALFALIGTGGLVINGVIMSIAVERFGQHYLIAKACAAAVTFSFNFGIRRAALFTRPALTLARRPIE
jgi:putative flippase GtrA